jgi:microcystin-dependent protein
VSSVTFDTGSGADESGLFGLVMRMLRTDAAGQALQEHLNLSPIPPGAVTAWAGDVTKTATIPAGWLPCDGRAVGRDVYPALFRAIGVSYGQGNGVSSFNLPDLRGRVPLGAGQGSGLTTRLVGQITGEEAHTLNTNELPSHAHLVRLRNDGNVTAGNFQIGSAGNTFGFDPTGTVGGSGADSGLTGTAGLGGGHNNMQPSLVVSYLIKT